MSHFDRWDILSDSKHGFRKRCSCETQLIETINDIPRHISYGNQVDVILLNFEKVLKYPIPDCSTHWIKSFLRHDRKQQVVLKGIKSRQEDILLGLPQGTLSGPFLKNVSICKRQLAVQGNPNARRQQTVTTGPPSLGAMREGLAYEFQCL